MNVLGLSGFDRAVAHKRAVLGPGADERLVRICQGMDAAAAIVVDGRVAAAAAEERYNGQKHSNRLPVGAIDDCLRQAGLDWRSIDAVAHGFDHGPFRAAFEFTPEGRAWYRSVLSSEVVALDLALAYPGRFDPAKFRPVRHHLAHAASTYYPSGFDRALVVVADGMGEVHGVTVYDGRGGRLEPLAEMPYTSSIGLLYGLVTLHLGFDFNSDEYKTMGLAPYGDPARYLGRLERLVRLVDGRFEASYLASDADPVSRESHAAARAALAAEFFPARDPDGPILAEHRDLAAGLQELTNRLMSGLVAHWMRATGHRRLCLAGGVALNCVANHRILETCAPEDFHVQPAAGDDGSALGAALWVSASSGQRPLPDAGLPLWGPSSDADEIARAMALPEISGLPRRLHPDERSAAEALARRLERGQIAALHQGRMEFGPRALGSRSILADPRDPQMREKINAAVKLREAFRPFAPAVTQEKFAEVFEAGPYERFPYMLVTRQTRPAWRDRLPAVVHVDGSARVQTVSRHDQPFLHATLEAFERLTGVPVLLNTSFNVKGQPITRTAEESVRTFAGIPIDALFLERHEISKGPGDGL